MKTLITKLLGLDTLVSDLALLKKQNEELKTKIENLENEVAEIEIPDMDDYVASCDLDDNIESYLNNNDYATTTYVDDEIESKVSDAIENEDIQSKIDEAIEDLDLESKTASTGEQDIEEKVTEAVKVTLERMVKALADQQK